MKLPKADYIVSCIPYSTIADPVRGAILKQSREVLNEDGALMMFQFTRVVIPHLKRHFRHVEQGFTALNILPAHIFYCRG
jgi:phospholipid N-methyltransferase